MTQISPRKSRSKRVVSRHSLSVLLCVGIVFAAFFVCNLCSPFRWSLKVVPSSENTSKLAIPKSSLRSGRYSSNPDANTYTNTGYPTKNAFDWSHIQVSQNAKGMCGADKCFWRSTSDPDSIGYLVASAGEHYQRMKRAYEFAVQVLDEKCKARHLFLEAPQLIRIGPTWAKKLNSLRHNDQAEFANKWGQRKKSKDVFDEDDHYMVVQKVKVAPKQNLMFGFMETKWEMLVERDIPRFRSELRANGISLRDMEVKLEFERKGIECAMEYSETYWYDLQGLIDLEGNYFHIDVDSQFWVEIGDPEDPDNTAVLTVNEAMAYKRRQNLVGRFNEMIQRLVYPPPEGVDELAAWGKNEGPNRRLTRHYSYSED